MRLLVVEDQMELREILRRQLDEKGYAADACPDAFQAQDYLEAAEYDIVILDIGLPGMDGVALVEWIRRKNLDVQVLLLTAMDSIEDKVRGLDSGADDYMTKPFAFEELLARLRMLARKKNPGRTNIYAVADLILNTSTGNCERAGREILLSRREYAVLEYLVMNKGQVLSRERIEAHVLDYSYEGASNLIDVYIRYLRRKVDEGHEKKLIHTVRGRGYMIRE
jgi:DNA-binding response OmpR family regulator